MIIPSWKKIGQSTHSFAQVIGKKIAQKTGNPDDCKATHTGTLDPMAEGVIIVLTGQDRFKKEQLSNQPKVYQFSILFGVSTDSHDLLGLQTKSINSNIKLEKLNKGLQSIIPNYIGHLQQKQPAFSAQRIKGKFAFQLAKQKKEVKSQTNSITIFSLRITKQNTITLQELEKVIKQKIALVTGDFRQVTIKHNWQTTLGTLKSAEIKQLPLISFETTVSKRTYIRALVRDMAQALSLPATTFSIVRVKNGPYTKLDCKKVI